MTLKNIFLSILRENEPKGGLCPCFLKHSIFFKSVFRNKPFNSFLSMFWRQFWSLTSLDKKEEDLWKVHTWSILTARNLLSLVGGRWLHRDEEGLWASPYAGAAFILLLCSKHQVWYFVRSIHILPKLAVSKLDFVFSLEVSRTGKGQKVLAEDHLLTLPCTSNSDWEELAFAGTLSFRQAERKPWWQLRLDSNFQITDVREESH